MEDKPGLHKREGVWSPTAEAVSYIINKTPLQLRIGRELFADALLEAWSLWLVYSPLDRFSAPRIKENARKGYRLAKQLRRICERFALCRPEKLAKAERQPEHVDELVLIRERVFEDMIERFRRWKAMREGPAPQLPRAPKEWFVADVLKPIFVDAFSHNATAPWSPKLRRYESPFVRFAVAVGDSMGIDISPTIVGHALKKKPRRKRNNKRPLLSLR